MKSLARLCQSTERAPRAYLMDCLNTLPAMPKNISFTSDQEPNRNPSCWAANKAGFWHCQPAPVFPPSFHVHLHPALVSQDQAGCFQH